MSGQSHTDALAREAVLHAAAALFDEIAAFMETVIPRTYADYQAAEPGIAMDALRLKHIQALRIRDDYRAARDENQRDVALLQALRATDEAAA